MAKAKKQGFEIEELMPKIQMPQRAYLRKLGGEYAEIAGFHSFERGGYEGDEGNKDTVSFVIAEKQSDAVNAILASTSDRFVEVKMEFSLGSLMIMTFSGFVKDYSVGFLSFTVSTPINTEVLESGDDLH
jgi:hypothetical protein